MTVISKSCLNNNKNFRLLCYINTLPNFVIILLFILKLDYFVASLELFSGSYDLLLIIQDFSNKLSFFAQIVTNSFIFCNPINNSR